MGRRINQTLVRGLSLTTEQAAALASRLVPVVNVDDLTKPWQSDEFTEQWGMFGAGVVAAAAETAQFAIENPVGSGKLMVLKSIWARLATAGPMGLTVLNEVTTVSTIAVSSNRQTLDGRWLRQTSILAQRGLAAITRAESDPALTPEAVLLRCEAASPTRFLDLNVIIAEGQSILMEARTAQIRLDLSYLWFEIPLEPGSQGGLG